MIPLITQDVAANIAYHAQLAWTYSVPNDTTGEIILTNGLKPFYPKAEQRGGSTTIVDVKVEDIAYDVKCRDVLKVFVKEHSKKQKARAPGQQYYKLTENLFVGRPTHVVSPVRRPSVNTENYQGDCQRIIIEQIQEYKDYANRTMAEAGCTELRSLLFLYGEKNGYKAIYIEEQEFSTPTPTRFETYINEKGEKAGYDAYDDKILYKLLDYSKGSTNFNKRFDCSSGFLFIWPSQSLSTQILTAEEWHKQGNYSLLIS